MIKYKSPFGIVITTGDAPVPADPKNAQLTTDDLERGPDGKLRLKQTARGQLIAAAVQKGEPE